MHKAVWVPKLLLSWCEADRWQSMLMESLAHLQAKRCAARLEMKWREHEQEAWCGLERSAGLNVETQKGAVLLHELINHSVEHRDVCRFLLCSFYRSINPNRWNTHFMEKLCITNMKKIRYFSPIRHCNPLFIQNNTVNKMSLWWWLQQEWQ